MQLLVRPTTNKKKEEMTYSQDVVEVTVEVFCCRLRGVKEPDAVDEVPQGDEDYNDDYDGADD